MTYRPLTRRTRRPSLASQVGAWIGVLAAGAAVFVMAWGIGVGATL